MKLAMLFGIWQRSFIFKVFDLRTFWCTVKYLISEGFCLNIWSLNSFICNTYEVLFLFNIIQLSWQHQSSPHYKGIRLQWKQWQFNVCFHSRIEDGLRQFEAQLRICLRQFYSGIEYWFRHFSKQDWGLFEFKARVSWDSFKLV